MPIVSVPRDEFLSHLGYDPSTYTDEEFEELCFRFGLELDDVTSEREVMAKQLGGDGKATAALSDETIYKIDVPANRYDLLCLEGLVRALRIFNGDEPVPEFRVVEPENMLEMTVLPETQQIRPYVVCAVLRGVTFTERSYQSFIDLQDKLHQNICRKRTLVAIGTHDLDTLTPPFTFEALPPQEIKFVPLNEVREFDAPGLFHYYREEKKQNILKNYLHIIEDSPVYPVIYDANRTVLSLPPIINGHHSRIQLSTRNVFIECTATDRTKANVVLNTVVSMFSQYCERPFEIEAVRVKYAGDNPAIMTGPNAEDSSEVVLPRLGTTHFTTTIDYINRGIGIQIEASQIVEILSRMQLAARYDEAEELLHVDAPCTRSDILHACDIQEDVAIAYGYNNIKKTLPNCATVARQQPINNLGDHIRRVVAEAGYTEVLTWTLVSHADAYDFMNKADDEQSVILSNPATVEFEIVRPTLIPGLLKCLANNAHQPLPVRIFEVGDCVFLDHDPASETGAQNNRRLAALFCSTSAGLEQVHGLTDRVLAMNDKIFKHQQGGVPDGIPEDRVYEYAGMPADDPEAGKFLPGRGANVILGGKVIGSFGTLHPTVLAHYGIKFPCSVMEIDLEVFL